MIFIHAADIHLGSPLGGLEAREDVDADAIRQAPMQAFERIADLCAEREAALLVLAGDLFDGDADLPTMYRAVAVLQRITRGGTKVVSLRGNHDAASKMSLRLPPIDGCFELPTRGAGTYEFPELGIAVHGRGFDQQHVPDNIVTDYPAAVPDLLNVGVLHTSLTPAAAGAHKAYAPCSPADLAAHGYQYWALGHVHQRAVIGDSPWIVFAGNPQGRDIGECGIKSVTVVEYERGAIVGVPEAVAVDGVRWHMCEVQLDADEGADALVERVRDQLSVVVSAAPEIGHVVRIVVRGRGAAHARIAAAPTAFRQQVHSAAMSIAVDGLWIERVVLDTQPALPDVEELLAREDFVGDAARMLLGSVERDDTLLQIGDAADTFAALDKKLQQLPAHALAGSVAPVADVDLDHARTALVGRLLEQHAAEAEASV
jgi:DNA repair exonuclease SbcCD nuclease subunit